MAKLTTTDQTLGRAKAWLWGWNLWGLMAPWGNALLGTIFLWYDAVTRRRFERLPSALRIPVPWCAGAMWISALFSPHKLIAFATAFAFSSMWYVIGSNYSFLCRRLYESAACRYLVWSGFFASIGAIIGHLLLGIERAVIGGLGFVGLGTTSIIMALFGFGYLSDRNTRLDLPYLAVITVGLVFTYTRGAWLGFAVAVMLYAVRSRKALVAIAVATLIFFVVVALVPANREYTVERFQMGDNSRFGIWATVVEMIKANPILGVGPGVHPVVYDQYLVEGAMPGAGHAHNMILGAFADLGMLGGVPLMWIMASIALASLKLVLRGATSTDRGLGAALIGVFVHQMFDIPIYGAQIGSLFYVLGALACIRAEGLAWQDAQSGSRAI